jgi:hypothetical protein
MRDQFRSMICDSSKDFIAPIVFRRVQPKPRAVLVASSSETHRGLVHTVVEDLPLVRRPL